MELPIPLSVFAQSTAERYVAELVQGCLGIVALFEGASAGAESWLPAPPLTEQHDRGPAQGNARSSSPPPARSLHHTWPAPAPRSQPHPVVPAGQQAAAVSPSGDTTGGDLEASPPKATRSAKSRATALLYRGRKASPWDCELVQSETTRLRRLLDPRFRRIARFGLSPGGTARLPDKTSSSSPGRKGATAPPVTSSTGETASVPSPPARSSTANMGKHSLSRSGRISGSATWPPRPQRPRPSSAGSSTRRPSLRRPFSFKLNQATRVSTTNIAEPAKPEEGAQQKSRDGMRRSSSRAVQLPPVTGDSGDQKAEGAASSPGNGGAAEQSSPRTPAAPSSRRPTRPPIGGGPAQSRRASVHYRGEGRRDAVTTVVLEEPAHRKSMDADMKDTLHSVFSGSKTGTEPAVLTGCELRQLSLEVSMSVDDVLLAKAAFDSFDANCSGALDAEEFENAVAKMLALDTATPEKIKSVSEWHWWESDKDKSGTIGFSEFLKWCSSNGFNEDLLLTEEQRSLRKMAKQFNVSADYVENIKRCFDFYDKDKSEEIDLDEFKHVLYKALKVPSHLELPSSRIQYFWQELDTDGSGKAAFDEFFSWWIKYFDTNGESQGGMPFEAFYKQIRRMGRRFCDPPAYPLQGDVPPAADDAGADPASAESMESDVIAMPAG